MKPDCILFIEASTSGAGEVACTYAKRSGLAVILISSRPAQYGEAVLKHCDIVLIADTTSPAALIEYTEIINQDYKIIGVTTTSDFHVVHAAALAAHLALPGNHPQVVERIKNKYKMREAIAKIAPELNPAYAIAYTFEDAQRLVDSIGYPLVAKPLTGNDSLYVKRVDDLEELRAYFDKRNSWGLDSSGQMFANGVLLEQMLVGMEYCLDVLRSLGGDLIPIGVFSKKISEGEHGSFIKIAASFPTAAQETRQLVDAILPVVDALGFKAGAIDIDCKIVDGNVKILEMNPRLVGDQMGSHMIEIASGQNPAHAIVDIACGQIFHWKPTQNRGVAIHRLTMPCSGYFGGISNIDMLERQEGVELVNELGVKGRWIEVAESNQGVIASIIVSHPSSADEAMKIVTRLVDKAHIDVQSRMDSIHSNISQS